MTEQTPLFANENNLMVHTPNGNFKLQGFNNHMEAINAFDLPILVIVENAGANKIKIWDNVERNYIYRAVSGSVYIDKCSFNYKGKKYKMGKPDNEKGNEKGYWLVS